MRRVVRKGGKLILNSPWVPKIPKMILESVMIGIPKAAWKNCIPVATYRKPADDIRGFFPAEIIPEVLTSFQDKQTSEEILK